MYRGFWWWEENIRKEEIWDSGENPPPYIETHLSVLSHVFLPFYSNDFRSANASSAIVLVGRRSGALVWPWIFGTQSGASPLPRYLAWGCGAQIKFVGVCLRPSLGRVFNSDDIIFLCWFAGAILLNCLVMFVFGWISFRLLIFLVILLLMFVMLSKRFSY